jgi:nucleoside-diphosphate-sugar epimerase
MVAACAAVYYLPRAQLGLRMPEDDPRQRRPDISLAQKLLGWAPRVQLRDGLMKTIEYFERLLRSSPRDERLPIRSAAAAG